MHRYRRLPLMILLLLLASCSRPPGRTGILAPTLGPNELREAEQRTELLVAHSAAGEWQEASAVALEILERYPGSPREPEVLLLGAQAHRQRGEAGIARRLLTRLVQVHADSPEATEGHRQLAGLQEAAGRWLDAAENWIVFHDRSTDERGRAFARDRLRTLVDERLSLEELDELGRRHPRSVSGSYVHYVSVQRRIEAGEDATVVGPRLEAFLREYPESRYAPEMRSRLAELRRREGYAPDAGLRIAAADRVGMLCPLTGEYAALGQAMYDGALLALEEYNRASGDSVTLVCLDTRGDAVVAVKAARRLVEQEAVIAVVGALLSPTTVAVATLCEERGVPLVSPTATMETIAELGPHVFQTNLTTALETRLLARAATRALLKQRFALLLPADEEGDVAGELFAAEVERQGGIVVARQTFERGTTDFTELLLRLRSLGPEALFVPASPSEMRLIAPQLTFHDLEVQLLGPSSWNNSLLVREAGEAFDRALFPSDIAAIPEAERARFEQLWSRRYRETASSPFGLKSYFAMRRLLEGLGQGLSTRAGLRAHLEISLDPTSSEANGDGLAQLRMVDGGEMRPFPTQHFPLARPAPEPALVPAP